jgi:hypothetical protein
MLVKKPPKIVVFGTKSLSEFLNSKIPVQFGNFAGETKPGDYALSLSLSLTHTHMTLAKM